MSKKTNRSQQQTPRNPNVRVQRSKPRKAVQNNPRSFRSRPASQVGSRAADGTIRLRKKELWYSSTDATHSGTFAAGSFPKWFTNMSEMYETYKLHAISVSIVTGASATTAGMLLQSYEVNRKEVQTIPLPEYAMAEVNSLQKPVREASVLRIPISAMRGFPDRRTTFGSDSYSFFHYYISTATGLTYNVFVDYDVTFYTPQLRSSVSESFVLRGVAESPKTRVESCVSTRYSAVAPYHISDVFANEPIIMILKEVLDPNVVDFYITLVRDGLELPLLTAVAGTLTVGAMWDTFNNMGIGYRAAPAVNLVDTVTTLTNNVWAIGSIVLQSMDVVRSYTTTLTSTDANPHMIEFRPSVSYSRNYDRRYSYKYGSTSSAFEAVEIPDTIFPMTSVASITVDPTVIEHDELPFPKYRTELPSRLTQSI